MGTTKKLCHLKESGHTEKAHTQGNCQEPFKVVSYQAPNK